MARGRESKSTTLEKMIRVLQTVNALVILATAMSLVKIFPTNTRRLVVMKINSIMSQKVVLRTTITKMKSLKSAFIVV